MRLFGRILLWVLAAGAAPSVVLLSVHASQTGSVPTGLWMAAGVGLTVSSLVALGLATFLTRPVQAISREALNIARGTFGGQVDYRAEHELGELTKAFNYMSAQIEAFDAENKRLGENLESGYLETIVALANSIDSKDSYTRGHSQRVADLAVDIGRELLLSELELKRLRYGGILHDIGKIGIVESILMKDTKLTTSEMEAMRDHPVIGDRIIKPVSFLGQIRSAVRNHHEWWDGTGYPDRLKGDEIPLAARIINAADTWDACTSTRPYQRALPEAEAIAVIQKLTGTQLDPAVAAALEKVVARRREKAAIHDSSPLPRVVKLVR